jgi:hypothetical protein
MKFLNKRFKKFFDFYTFILKTIFICNFLKISLKIVLTSTSTTTTASTTTTNSTSLAYNIFGNINQTSVNASYILGILNNPIHGNLNPCLANCSNQGHCVLLQNQQLVCECNQKYTGNAYINQ